MSFLSPTTQHTSFMGSELFSPSTKLTIGSYDKENTDKGISTIYERNMKLFGLFAPSDIAPKLVSSRSVKRARSLETDLVFQNEEEVFESGKIPRSLEGSASIEALIVLFTNWDDISKFDSRTSDLIFHALEKLNDISELIPKKKFAMRIKNSLLFKTDCNNDIGTYDWQSFFSLNKNLEIIKIVINESIRIINECESREAKESLSVEFLKSQHETPDRVRKAFDVIARRDFKWTPNRFDLVREGFKSLSEVESETKRAELITRARQDLVGSIPLDTVDSVKKINQHLSDPTEKDSVSLVLNLSNKEALNILSPMSPRMMKGIRFEHLVRSWRGEGWHFCGEEDARYSKIEDKVTNLENGVWIGKFGKKRKFSSFFPKGISSLEDCVKIMQDTEVCASYKYGEKGKSLRRYISATQEFYFLEIEEKSRVVTMYPLFFAKYYNDIPDTIEIKTDKGVFFSTHKHKILKKIQTLSDIEKKDKILISLNEKYHLVDISMMEGLSLEKSAAIFFSSQELKYQPIWE
jgi:hypothetical protein